MCNMYLKLQMAVTPSYTAKPKARSSPYGLFMRPLSAVRKVTGKGPAPFEGQHEYVGRML